MEALLRTFRGWTRIRNPEHADAYLRRAVVNLCRSRIRRKAIEARVGVLAPRSAPLWDAEARDTQRVVWEAVRGLPPRQRACVVLRYYEDLPEREIAEILECSVGTVKSQLAKARSRLERVLEETLSGGER
jgi:RNA polymerase sigma factor (sigma-70 family)